MYFLLSLSPLFFSSFSLSPVCFYFSFLPMPVLSILSFVSLLFFPLDSSPLFPFLFLSFSLLLSSFPCVYSSSSSLPTSADFTHSYHQQLLLLYQNIYPHGSVCHNATSWLEAWREDNHSKTQKINTKSNLIN